MYQDMLIYYVLYATPGRCLCQHNTVGKNCEQCAPGFYGYALAGTPEDCKRCPCPDGGDCVELMNGDVVCINCREGYTGNIKVCWKSSYWTYSRTGLERPPRWP